MKQIEALRAEEESLEDEKSQKAKLIGEAEEK